METGEKISGDEEIFQHEVFKAVTLKSVLETPTAKNSKHLTMAFKMKDEY